MVDPFRYGPDPDARRRGARLLLTGLLALVLLGVATGVPVVAADDRDASGPGGVTLDAVLVYPDLQPSHTRADVDYAQVPPAGGPHNPAWLGCGVYDAPVPDENAVHDLEHGSVWITHAPGLDAFSVRTLAEALPPDGIMSPYAGLPAPIVVTVWGRQLRLERADDPRLALFVAEYSDGHTAPEPGASCRGGLSPADTPPVPTDLA